MGALPVPSVCCESRTISTCHLAHILPAHQGISQLLGELGEKYQAPHGPVALLCTTPIPRDSALQEWALGSLHPGILPSLGAEFSSKAQVQGSGATLVLGSCRS